MKGTDEDFVIDKPKRQFQLKGNDFVFEYEEPSVGEIADWRGKYISLDLDGKEYMNVLNLGTCIATKLKTVPWREEVIEKVIGQKKDWQLMSFEEKWNLIRNLEGKTYLELITSILIHEGYAKENIQSKKKVSKGK